MDDMDYVMQHAEASPAQGLQPRQSGCPYWREQSNLPQLPHLSSLAHNQAFTSPHRNPSAHPHYDPVNNSWFAQPTPSYQWDPSSATHPPPQPPHRHHRTSSSDLYYSGPGSAGSSAGTPGGPPVSGPPLIHNQPNHHDLFAPLAFNYAHPPIPRFGPGPPVQNQPNHQLHSQHDMSFASDRSLFGRPNHRVTSLPSLNPPPPPPPAPISQQRPNMVRSGEISPTSMAGANTHPPPRAPFTSSMGSMVLPEPSRPQPPALGNDATNADLLRIPPLIPRYAESDSAATPPLASSSERRRPAVPRPRRSFTTAGGSDLDSDEEASEPLSDEQHAMRLVEQFQAAHPSPYRSADVEEARIRANQLLRGQMSNKRVASKNALSSLRSVEISSLPESERTCVICYNDFGVENPEGINEAPLRLPKCKHVFGDHCIKKWFEESDSCPYCRDKLPSEPQLRPNSQAFRDFLRTAYMPQMPRFTRTNGDSVRMSGHAFGLLRGDPETYARYLVQRDESRFDGSPPRAWQTGERRSPPSELSENRRRTRPRHGSFRGSASSAALNVATSPGRPNSFAGISPSGVTATSAPHPQPQVPQLSPARERPHAAHQRSYHFGNAGMGGYSGNSTFGRHVNFPPYAQPSVFNPPLLSSDSMDVNTVPLSQPTTSPGSVQNQPQPQTFPSGGSMNSGMHFPITPSEMTAFSQPLPPVGAAGTGFSNFPPTMPTEAQSGPAAESW